MAEKIFVNGFISKDVPDTAPDYILGKGSLHVESLVKWLQDNKGLAENGYINITTLRSKTTGKRYTEVDTYKKPVAVEEPKEVAAPVQTGGYTGPVGPGDYDGTAVNPDDIPF